MRKNFFKKLSFVLALAMVMSVIAPAAGAYAATAPKLNATTKYLHLGVDGLNEYDFNIKYKLSGWTYDWSSADEDVAVVESNGFTTATGVGTTKVSVVISDKDGEEVDTLEATVKVRDNIKTLAITNLPKDDKMAVGAENDFNRSFVTNSGSTTKTSGITRWIVDKPETATISDSGVFKATAAGVYKITANSFQSKEKYDAWKVDSAANAANVTATKDYTVTVNASMVSAQQVDLDTFKVTFDTAVTDAAAKLTLSQLVSGTKVNWLIKGVAMDADKKVATVDVFVPFTVGSTYVVDYPTMAAVQFVAATTKSTDVTSIAITTTTAQIAIAKTIDVALYNKDGVNIANADLLTRLSFATSTSASYLYGNSISLFKVGDTTTVTATYHTYNYDTTTGSEIGVLTAAGVIICVDQSSNAVGLINAYTVAGSANWKDVKHSVAAGDPGLNLFVQLKGLKSNGWEVLYTDNINTPGSTTFGTGIWKYTTSDSEIAIVNPSTGTVYPAKEGSVVVVVSYNDIIVGTATITVSGARKVANVSLDSYQFSLSNDDDVMDTKSIGVTVKDQLGSDFGSYNIKTEINGLVPTGLLTSSEASKPITFNAAGIKEGQYSFKVTFTDTTNWTSFVRHITVTVMKPSSDDVVYYYRAEASSSSVDMNINTWKTWSDDAWKANVTVSLFGYASNSVRNVRVNLGAADASGFQVTVTDPWGGVCSTSAMSGSALAASGSALSASGNDAVYALISKDANLLASKKPTGTYKVNATMLATATVSSAAVNASIFTVTDTQEAPVLTVNKTYSTQATILGAVNDCLGITIHGDAITVAADTDITKAGETSTQVFVQKVYVTESIGSYIKVRHEIAVNRTINYAQAQ